MIFTSSDIGSLSRQLWWWEHAEYVFAALVAIACLGEYIADFNKRAWVVAHKDGIAKRATLLLIAALALELVCLIRTNELSGNVIGSLGQKAEEAGAKAREAITDASTALLLGKDALTKAEAAKESLGKAEDEANRAQTAAANALTLATGARQEADSFEKDIASAKKQAAEAESHLAEAMKRAKALTAELERITTPRRLSHSAQALEPLKAFMGTEYMFIGTCGIDECFDLLSDIDELLESAKWKRVKGPVMRIGIPQVTILGDKDFAVDINVSTGIRILFETPNWDSVKSLPEAQQAKHVRAAIALNGVLASNVSPPENTGRVPVVQNGPSTVVKIDVGAKPYP